MKKVRRFAVIAGFGIGLIVVLALAITRPASAAEFRGGDTVVIPADELIDDDLFIAGSRVEMNGTVTGDLFASGSEVVVGGSVEGSAFVSGYSITMDGTVEGSLYGGAYSLTIARGGEIGRNVYFGGFSLEIERGSHVGTGVYTGNYQTIIDGIVGGDVSSSSAALVINGSVGGDVRGEVGASTDGGAQTIVPAFPGSVAIRGAGLEVGDEAVIGGEIDVQVTEDGDERPGNFVTRFVGRTVSARIGEYLALLIVGGLLLWLWPASMLVTREQAEADPLPSAGWGCVTTIAFYVLLPIAAVVVFLAALVGGLVTLGELFSDILLIGGSSLALALFAFGFVISLVTKAIVSFLGGRWILNRVIDDFSASGWANFGALALGAFIYEILRVIPFFGWLLSIVVTIVGLGAIVLVLRSRFAPPKPIAEAAA